MRKTIPVFVGLDVHKETSSVAYAAGGSVELVHAWTTDPGTRMIGSSAPGQKTNSPELARSAASSAGRSKSYGSSVSRSARRVTWSYAAMMSDTKLSWV